MADLLWTLISDVWWPEPSDTLVVHQAWFLAALPALAPAIAKVVGGLFSAKSAGKAADTQSSALREQSAAQERIAAQEDKRLRDAAALEDARLREAEAYLRERQGLQDQRFAPYRALGESAAFSLGDALRMPGSRPMSAAPSLARGGAPAASGVNTSEARALTEEFRAAHPELGVGDFRAYADAYTPFMAERGYQVSLLEHPDRLDKFQITGPGGQTFITDQVMGAGGNDPRLGWIVEGSGGGAPSSAPRLSPRGATPDPLLARYGRQETLKDLLARRPTGGPSLEDYLARGTRGPSGPSHIVWGS